MADRYRSQISQGSLPNAYMRSHVDGAATGVQIAGAVERGGEEIRKYAEVRKRRQDEWDAARVMEAQTEYNRVMSDFMDNPETGVTNVRKLGAARGVTEETDKYGDEAAVKIAETLDNEAQRQVFLRAAQRAKIPYWKQGSDFEAREVKTYRDQIFKTTLDQGGLSVQRAPLDDVAFSAALEQGANAIRSQYYGADESVVNAAVDEYASGLEQQRLFIVAAEDPILASRLIESSRYLTPEAQAKLKDSVAAEVELLRTQETVDQLVTEFGPDREQEGLAAIREEYEGKEEERLASAYKTRINEMKVREGNADAELRKMQKENSDRLYRDFYGRGDVPPQSTLDGMLQRKEISPEEHRKMTGWGEVSATRAELTQNFAKQDPNWNSYSTDEQESRVMRAMGKTPEQRKEALNRIKSGVLDGSVTDAEIKAEYSNGNITKTEMDYYTGLEKKFEKEQKDFVKQQKNDLKIDLEKINIPGKNNRIYSGIAQSVFVDKASRLDPTSKTYRQEVMDARREALVAAVEASGKSLEQGTWLGLGAPAKTKFGQRVDDVRTALEEATGNVKEYRPEMIESNVDLTPRPDEGPAYKKRFGAGRPPRARELSPNLQGEKAVFVDGILPDIMEVAQSTGIMPEIILAQAMLESNWGKNSPGNNLFGIKAGQNWRGKTHTSATREESGGKMNKTTAAFRAYDSVGESVADYGRLMSGDRYAVVRNAKSYEEAAYALQKSGYATDSNYAQKLISLVKTYELGALSKPANAGQKPPAAEEAARENPPGPSRRPMDEIFRGGITGGGA